MKLFLFLLIGFSITLLAQDNPTPSSDTIQSSAETTTEIEEKELEVAVGIDETIKIDYKYSTTVEIGNPGMLNVVLIPSKQEVTFKGLKEGRTSVVFRNTLGERKTRYMVTVTADEKSKKVSDLRDLLGDIEGIEIGIKGGRVYIGGEIVVPTDIGKIEAVVGNSEEFLLIYELSPQTQRVIAKKMQDEIAKSGMKNVTVRVVNGVYWAEGVVASKDQFDLTEKIVIGYLPPKVKSLYSGAVRGAEVKGKNPYELFLTIDAKKQKQPPEKLLKISSQFVELARDYTKVFAFKWAPLTADDSGQIRFGRTEDGGVSSDSSGTLSGVISNLFPKLQSAKDAGYARVIQSGMIVVKNNIEGKITKTTKTYFGVGSGEFTRAQEADIGFNMAVTPRVGEDEDVLMSLSIGVNLPTGETSSSGGPVNSKNEVSTQVVVKSKQSAVIGGVVQNQTLTSYDKSDPAPVKAEGGSPLFTFLRSKSYKTNKNQFVIFVTPEIIESASEGTEEIRKKFKRRTR
jgi:pilus assembly protein CpaC